ncbi:nuclear transport factor 2 family protein [Dactylosporangium sp. AC04546]|uniref:nuclear transport factor 2 family protein n=1 Tax=unclassified Dactylosporangium TaxID=2621675 RepID=UPI001EDF6347|nr:nuclear transport factor 2 family protein [Dactylosporangium sp. AC04546]WVK86463.1 nuclear transport factor 2 family protein [Dactylosporangium sp. AC04546]
MNATDDGSTTHLVQQLLDREAIRETLHRYCRGVDRVDADAIRSAYWPDAHDTHGAYTGGPEGLIERTQEIYGATDHVVHTVASVGIDLRGSQANVEAYYLAWFGTENDDDGARVQTFVAGRYLDLFEKRGDEWRILKRTCVYDWIHRLPLPEGMGEEVFGERRPFGRHAPDDEIYRLGFA